MLNTGQNTTKDTSDPNETIKDTVGMQQKEAHSMSYSIYVNNSVICVFILKTRIHSQSQENIMVILI